MRVSIALLIAAFVAPVLAAPVLDLGASNALVRRNVAPVDATGLSKREVSVGSASRDIDTTSSDVYARDDSSQLPQLISEAVAEGILSQSQANSLLANINAANDPQVTSTMITALSKLLEGYSTGAISQEQASALLAPFAKAIPSTNDGAGGSVGGLLSLVTGLLSTVLGLLGAI